MPAGSIDVRVAVRLFEHGRSHEQGLVATAVAIPAFAGTGVGQALGATLIVDDDGLASPPSNCGSSTVTFSQIEPAVEASNPGDTVNVCPGTYPEQVSVGGGSAIVRGNRITEMHSANPALRGCQNGFALAVGRSFEMQTGNVTAFGNHLDLYQKGGIYVDNAGSSAVLAGNLIHGEGPTPIIAQNGIQISRGAVVTATANVVQDQT